jgi:hypothetical protein
MQQLIHIQTQDISELKKLVDIELAKGHVLQSLHPTNIDTYFVYDAFFLASETKGVFIEENNKEYDVAIAHRIIGNAIKENVKYCEQWRLVLADAFFNIFNNTNLPNYPGLLDKINQGVHIAIEQAITKLKTGQI